MDIPLVNLKRQYENLKEDIDFSIQRVLDNTSFILGSEVENFEKEFADFTKTKNSIGVSSGTDALFMALKALNIGRGDEVIVPANTFIATALAVSFSGAKPVFVDCNEIDYTIDVSKLQEALSDKTKAIMPVHLYGQTADMDAVMDFAEDNDLKVVEDACQAHGADFKGKSAGSMGDIGCFSFYPGKNLGAFGDGGALVTNNKELDEELRSLRNYGQTKKYHHEKKGYNFRLDSLQAAILSVKLKHLNNWNDLRRKNADTYREGLKTLDYIQLPEERDDSKHVYHLFVIRSDKRDELLEFFHSRNIQAGIHYPIPVHLQKAYSDLGYSKGDFPVAEKLAKEIISLPLFPEMKQEESDYVIKSIFDFYTT